MKKKISKTAFSLAKTPLGDIVVGVAFGKLSKALPVKKIEETDNVIAFWHPKPFWEEHILIVPKRRIKSIASVNDEDLRCVKDCFQMAQKLIKKLDWLDSGYSLMINGGKRQEVNQLHFHLLSGEKL